MRRRERRMGKPELGGFIDDGQRQQGQDDNHERRLGEHPPEWFRGKKRNKQALHFGGSFWRETGGKEPAA